MSGLCGHLNLIISGSVFTLMKKIFEDYEESLFGRADEKLTLQPFKTDVLKEILYDFNPDYTPEDLLALFSITGGVAWYVTKALKALGDIIKRDYDGLSGLMMERYFVRKFQEEGRYIVGKWWDRKGFNEIDLVVVDPIGKEAWAYELKKDESRYDETSFKEKVDTMVDQTPELRKMAIHVGLLSKKDM